MPRPSVNSIDADALMRVRSLELRARAVVEGFLAGLHRSPYHGFSVEFTEYRPYAAGDDPRYLDWKLFARSDRFYIKQFEDETNLRCYLLLDGSRSMAFGSLGYTKADYARTLAATLAYFLQLQRDAVGLARIDVRLEDYIPARHRSGHFRRLLAALDRPAEGQGTDLSAPLDDVAERIGRRGLLVLISDLLAPVDELSRRLGYFRARGHEVVVFHVLDPAERELAFTEPSLIEDIESGRQIYVDPAYANELYKSRMAAHSAAIAAACSPLGIDLYRVWTDTPLDQPLSEFLLSRQRGAARVRPALAAGDRFAKSCKRKRPESTSHGN